MRWNDPYFWGLIPFPYSFQPSFFSKIGCFPWGSAGFLERRIPGKNGEVSPRRMAVVVQKNGNPKMGCPGKWKGVVKNCLNPTNVGGIA